MVLTTFLTFSLLFVELIGGEKNVAIIGGGIGGTSAAFFLRQKISNKANIELIDDKEGLGGRVATVHVPSVRRDYEIGGSIIHSSNKLMTDFLGICDMKKKASPPDAPFTLHKDGEIVFQEWGYPLLDKVRMGLRYGVESAMKLEYFVDNLLKSFSNIYDELDKPDTYFETVEEMLKAMSPVSRTGDSSDEMMDLTKVTLAEKLLSLGVDPLLVDELVTVATRVNYGQMPDSLHAFVGSVGLAGTGGSLWAVEGGNKKIASCNMRNARASGYRGTATQISRKKEGFSVRIEFEAAAPVTKDYDAVIIAAPLTSDLGAIKLPADVEPNFPGHYHKTVATVVQGELIPSAVGFKADSSFTTTNFYLSPTSDIVSIAKLTPVDYKPGEDDDLPSVYKIFSKRKFSESELNEMFTDINFTHTVPWLAYPHYSTKDDFSSFELAPGLYYLNRMEWAASAMEMSAISAKNVAKMAADFLYQKKNSKVEL